ncbi:hypothetical protein BJ742DRAFT_789067 [Cladochytrium replicatum]|nr:hypothetical protein BJ742DRAFT_789067 [Cladochytrium replicatum]
MAHSGHSGSDIYHHNEDSRITIPRHLRDDVSETSTLQRSSYNMIGIPRLKGSPSASIISKSSISKIPFRWRKGSTATLDSTMENAENPRTERTGSLSSFTSMLRFRRKSSLKPSKWPVTQSWTRETSTNPNGGGASFDEDTQSDSSRPPSIDFPILPALKGFPKTVDRHELYTELGKTSGFWDHESRDQSSSKLQSSTNTLRFGTRSKVGDGKGGSWSYQPPSEQNHRDQQRPPNFHINPELSPSRDSPSADSHNGVGLAFDYIGTHTSTDTATPQAWPPLPSPRTQLQIRRLRDPDPGLVVETKHWTPDDAGPGSHDDEAWSLDSPASQAQSILLVRNTRTGTATPQTFAFPPPPSRPPPEALIHGSVEPFGITVGSSPHTATRIQKLDKHGGNPHNSYRSEKKSVDTNDPCRDENDGHISPAEDALSIGIPPYSILSDENQPPDDDGMEGHPSNTRMQRASFETRTTVVRNSLLSSVSPTDGGYTSPPDDAPTPRVSDWVKSISLQKSLSISSRGTIRTIQALQKNGRTSFLVPSAVPQYPIIGNRRDSFREDSDDLAMSEATSHPSLQLESSTDSPTFPCAELGIFGDRTSTLIPASPILSYEEEMSDPVPATFECELPAIATAAEPVEISISKIEGNTWSQTEHEPTKAVRINAIRMVQDDLLQNGTPMSIEVPKTPPCSPDCGSVEEVLDWNNEHKRECGGPEVFELEALVDAYHESQTDIEAKGEPRAPVMPLELVHHDVVEDGDGSDDSGENREVVVETVEEVTLVDLIAECGLEHGKRRRAGIRDSIFSLSESVQKERHRSLMEAGNGVRASDVHPEVKPREISWIGSVGQLCVGISARASAISFVTEMEVPEAMDVNETDGSTLAISDNTQTTDDQNRNLSTADQMETDAIKRKPLSVQDDSTQTTVDDAEEYPKLLESILGNQKANCVERSKSERESSTHVQDDSDCDMIPGDLVICPVEMEDTDMPPALVRNPSNVRIAIDKAHVSNTLSRRVPGVWVFQPLRLERGIGAEGGTTFDDDTKNEIIATAIAAATAAAAAATAAIAAIGSLRGKPTGKPQNERGKTRSGLLLASFWAKQTPI